MLITLFQRLPQRLLVPYRGYLWVWHVIAAVITAAAVFTGFDWWFFRQTRNESLLPLVMVGGIGGMLIPVVLPILLYIQGKRRKDEHLIRAAVAVTQATIIAWIIVAVYKVFTGRIQPDFLITLDSASVSSGFQFGFFEHGVFWGWPSHHTVVAVAGATVLYLALKNPVARFGTFVWAGVVATGAAVGFHWFSDMVAGAIVGIVVGFAVWRDVGNPSTMKLTLQKGQVAVLRTDTLYGLVAKASDKEAVEKVYQLKGRDFTKPCIILVADKEVIGQHGDLVEQVLSEYDMPTTVVVPKTVEPEWITRGGSTVAYRIPKSESLKEILRESGPLIAPSANPQGLLPARTIEEARNYFGDQVDRYIDGGAVSESAKASRVVEILESGDKKEVRT